MYLKDNILESEYINNPSSIFLTGATGFLGAFLLDELLKQTEAKVYCLVRRCSDLEEGIKRIKDNLAFYQLWHKSYKTRIVPVLGDLSQPNLGLSLKDFQQLAIEIDVIHHCGALVKWNRSYEELKPINVLGTHSVVGTRQDMR